jgi:LuxR family maltose regulon positive regulatory protein
LGEVVVAQLQSPQPPPLVACLSALLHELESCEAHPVPIALVVDDYQVISDPAIHEGVAFFLEHLPASLHLILSSRVDPDLPLSRLRVRGQLIEFRMDELRFSFEEASHYFGQMLSPILSTEEVRQLVYRTEGWIAGLHLAALTLQKRADRAAYLEALTGSQRYLLDYVQEDILARLPQNVRDFVLQSAILSQMSASVCQAVTGVPTRAASQQLLTFLERANLFLVPLDEERHSYRLHELFREALLSVLDTGQPELVPLLHRRAASFYETQGQWTEAIAHRLEARDYSAAARLMEQTVEQFWMRGEAATIARWALALPQQTVREHARLLLTTAQYLRTTGANTAHEQRTRVYQEMRQLIARVETALRRERDEISQEVSAKNTPAGAVSAVEDQEARATEDTLLHRRLRLLRLFLVMNEVTAGWDFERLSTMQQEIEEELEQDEEIIWQIIPLTCHFIYHYSFRLEGASLVPRLLEAKERASRSESRYVTHIVRQFLAMAAVEAGRLHLAYQESLAALDLIQLLAGYALLKGYFELAMIQVFYQWNRLEEARDLLHIMVQEAAVWQQLDLLAWGHACLMQVELARGDRHAAEFALDELEQVVRRERYGFYPGWLPTLRAQWWLAQGQVREASDWAEGVIFPQGPWGRNQYDAFPVVIQVYFARRSFREALSLLQRWSKHLDRSANIRITLTYLAQLLVALHQSGMSEQARAIAARLLALTEPEGSLRVYLDEGEPMREALLALLTPHSQQHEFVHSTRAYVVKLLAAFEHEEQGASTFLETTTTRAPALSLAPQPSPASLALGAFLTVREGEVLRLLAQGLTSAQIAEQLVLSPMTVNTHIRSIYSKLGVTSRSAATRYAIEHHLD